ncbi:hypothetical protein ABK040_000706 [Willaertia magna]
MSRPISATNSLPSIGQRDISSARRKRASSASVSTRNNQNKTDTSNKSTRNKTYNEYTPYYLRNVDYDNDILEVLKNKIDSQSRSFHDSFRRLKQSVGNEGWKVSLEDFKQALIKDYHLLENISEDIPNFEAIKNYQQTQLNQLEEFVKQADSTGDGYIRFGDFVRAVEDIEGKVPKNSTSSQRELRYSSSMNNSAIKRKQDLLHTLEEKQKTKPCIKPPFAEIEYVPSEATQAYNAYKQKLNSLRNAFQITGDENEKIPLDVFREKLKKFDRYIQDREIDDIINVLGARKKGYILLKDFMEHYGIETLKTKSFRGSYEATKTLQWPKTLVPYKTTNELIDELRDKKGKSKLKSGFHNTRSNILRSDKIKRELIFGSVNNSKLAATGFVSEKEKLKQHIPQYLDHIEEHRENQPKKYLTKVKGKDGFSPSFMKTPAFLISPNVNRSIRLADAKEFPQL